MDSRQLRDWLNENNLMLVKMGAVLTDKDINELCEDIEVSEIDEKIDVEGSGNDFWTISAKGDSSEPFQIEYECDCPVFPMEGVCHHIECVRLYYLHNKEFPSIPERHRISADIEIRDSDFSIVRNEVTIYSYAKARFLFSLIVNHGYSIAQLKKYYSLDIPAGKLFYAIVNKVRSEGKLKYETIR